MGRLNLGFSLRRYSTGPSPVPLYSCGYTHSDPYRRRSRDGLRRLHDRRGPVQRDAALLAALRHCQQPPGGWFSAGGESVRSILCAHGRLGERHETAICGRFRRDFCHLRSSLTEEGNIGSLCGAHHRSANVVSCQELCCESPNSKPLTLGRGCLINETHDSMDETCRSNR